MLLTKFRMKLRNGVATLFWHDIGVGPSPLKKVCPRLFSISPTKNASVASHGFWDGLNWRWSLGWTRNLRPRDAEEAQVLQGLLDRATLSPSDPDYMVWTPSKLGDFSVKSFMQEMPNMDSHAPCSLIKGLWRGLFPPRIEVFI